MDGDGEGEGVLLLRILAFQQKILAVQDVLAVAVLHNNPEGFHPSMDLLVPLKIWRDSQIHLW